MAPAWLLVLFVCVMSLVAITQTDWPALFENRKGNKQSMPDKSMICFQCPNMGTVLAIIVHARLIGAAASYHPDGGDLLGRHIDITHRVYIVGELGELYAIRTWIKENHESDTKEI